MLQGPRADAAFAPLISFLCCLVHHCFPGMNELKQNYFYFCLTIWNVGKKIPASVLQTPERRIWQAKHRTLVPICTFSCSSHVGTHFGIAVGIGSLRRTERMSIEDTDNCRSQLSSRLLQLSRWFWLWKFQNHSRRLYCRTKIKNICMDVEHLACRKIGEPKP